ncbi:MAG: hypothetical protein SPL30_07975 [Succinivibrio sp.]|jgi:hypothetical protein|nr:hypothetical protein [Succinivibrio sp.]
MRKTALSLALCALAALQGCATLDEITKGSPSAQVEDASQNNSQRQQRPKPRPQAVKESEHEPKGGNAELLISKREQPQEQKAAAADAQALSDEERALANTAVSDEDLASAPAAAGSQAEPSRDESAAEAFVLPPVDESTAAEISDLPAYATASGRQTCPLSMGQSAKQSASELALSLGQKLQTDPGKLYSAPTVIPEEYRDCIDDVSSAVSASLAKSGKFEAVPAENLSVMQNEGSALVIPKTVRECRRLNIPYLAVSVVHRIGGKAVITIRIIKVQTGVTMTQSYRRIG